MSVVNLRVAETLAQTAVEINKQLTLADKERLKSDDSKQRSKYARTYAGHMLKGAKRRIEEEGEGDGMTFAQWCDKHIDRSMRDINKLVKIASAEDPEEAAGKEREVNRAAKARSRARRADKADVSPNVTKAMKLIRAMTPDELECFNEEYEAFMEEQDG